MKRSKSLRGILTAKGEGFEYHILAVAIGLALMITGGGRWSVDGVIAGKLKR
jgi:putative oxidoreductase